MQQWKNDFLIKATHHHWYMDGLKTKQGLEAAIIRPKPRAGIRLSVWKEIEVFQPEIVAIHHCVRKILRQNTGYSHVC